MEKIVILSGKYKPESLKKELRQITQNAIKRKFTDPKKVNDIPLLELIKFKTN